MCPECLVFTFLNRGCCFEISVMFYKENMIEARSCMSVGPGSDINSEVRV